LAVGFRIVTGKIRAARVGSTEGELRPAMSDVKEKRVELILQQLEQLPTLPVVAVRVLRRRGGKRRRRSRWWI
jgi:hypothetical protein